MTLPVKGVQLKPFLTTTGGHHLNFRICNTGNLPAHLVEAEVMVPRIVLAPNFQAPAVPPVRDRIYGTVDDREAIGYRYKSIAGHIPTPIEPLPALFTPSMTSRVLEAISIPLRDDLHGLIGYSYRIRYKLCSPDFPSEDQYILLRDLPYE